MGDYVFYQGEVWRVMAKNHNGNEKLWYVQGVDMVAIWNRWIPADKCIPLDHALDVLFEERKDG